MLNLSTINPFYHQSFFFSFPVIPVVGFILNPNSRLEFAKVPGAVSIIRARAGKV